MAPGGLTTRPTPDLVLLIFAAVIGLSIVIATVGLVVSEVAHPEVDTTLARAWLQSIAAVLAGVVVGYLAGRNMHD